MQSSATVCNYFCRWRLIVVVSHLNIGYALVLFFLCASFVKVLKRQRKRHLRRMKAFFRLSSRSIPCNAVAQRSLLSWMACYVMDGLHKKKMICYVMDGLHKVVMDGLHKVSLPLSTSVAKVF